VSRHVDTFSSDVRHIRGKHVRTRTAHVWVYSLHTHELCVSVRQRRFRFSCFQGAPTLCLRRGGSSLNLFAPAIKLPWYLIPTCNHKEGSFNNCVFKLMNLNVVYNLWTFWFSFHTSSLHNSFFQIIQYHANSHTWCRSCSLVPPLTIGSSWSSSDSFIPCLHPELLCKVITDVLFW